MILDGTIIKGIGGFYYIKASDGKIYECKARGKFRNERIKPTIGDRVCIDVNGEKGSVAEIYPRKTYLVRPPVANVDMLVIVAAASSPEPNLFLLDKMVLCAEKNGITPVICINKTDLAQRTDIEDAYKKAGYTVLCTSVENNEGIKDVIDVIKNKTAAFAGLSGVGKSSLLTLITGEGLQTGSVSDKIRRGKHTTRHVELMELEGGGYVLDTPGFSSLEIEDIEAGELAKFFPEMAQYEGKCRFRGCSHINEPDCAVKSALENGDMAQSRYDSYTQLYEQLKKIKQWQK